jgi:Domain of unknown function (DUF5666)
MKTLVIVLAVVVGVLGGFYGGYKVGQNNVSASSNNTRASNNGFAQGRGALAAACPSPGATPSAGSQALARGTVTNLTATSMTVSNGTCDVTVTFSPATAVSKTAAGSTSDLADNQTVTVTGTRQSDGTVQAQSIAIGNGGSFRGPGASPSP